jgi:hypothetical protein
MACKELEYEFHPLADMLPLIEDEDFERFKKNAKNLTEPIWLLDGKILDGRNAYRARRELGLPIKTKQWKGQCGNARDFVIARNLDRRQLSSSQRAAVAVELLPELEKEAKQRQRAHGSTAPGKSKESLTQKVGGVFNGEACEEAATICGTNPEYVRRCKRIKDKDLGVFDDVKKGKRTIDEAEKSIGIGKKKRTSAASRKAATPNGSDRQDDERSGGEVGPEDSDRSSDSVAQHSDLDDASILGSLERANKELDALCNHKDRPVKDLADDMSKKMRAKCQKKIKSIRQHLEQLESAFCEEN